MTTAFATPIQDDGQSLSGPMRAPRQMLATQEYDAHTSIHDDATARKLGFKGGTIEGPTHFSQFAPLCVALWGPQWLEQGCLSAHYRNAAFEGERVQAFVTKPSAGAKHTQIWMQREDGTEILRGTASIGDCGVPVPRAAPDGALTARASAVILRDVRVGLHTPRIPVRMDAEQNMGALYPFSLADKLQAHHRALALVQPRRSAGFALAPRRSFRSRWSACCSTTPTPRSIPGPRSGGRPVRRSGDPHAPRAAVRRRELRDRSGSGRVEREPAHREHVDSHARVPTGERGRAGEHAAELCQPQRLLRELRCRSALLCKPPERRRWIAVSEMLSNLALRRSTRRGIGFAARWHVDGGSGSSSTHFPGPVSASL